MIPVLTPAELREADAASPEPAEVLVARAGAAVARSAARLMGGTYGRHVVVVAGKGNNGADGRVAAALLGRRGARVSVLDASAAPAALPPCDLVVDAAYGTGFRGDYAAPDPGRAPVLAVDVPSGVDGLTGEAGDRAVRADLTVTFAALKPGLLLGAGRDRAGVVEVVDIGLDAGAATVHLVDDGDAALLPARPRHAHKWQSAVFVAGGSPGLCGAPLLAARAALRAGAGTVLLGVPGARLDHLPATEVVAVELPAAGWAGPALEAAGRCRALVVGPGLGRGGAVAAEVGRFLLGAPAPVVVDADALDAVDGPVPGAAVRVLTPHAGEYRRLCGRPPGPDLVADARALARRTGAVAVLKGATTVVADPAGRVLLAASGGPRLATAGTGDVLAGVVAAFLAMGVDPPVAAALGAHAHGAAAALGPERGLVAGDVVDLLPRWLSARGRPARG